MNRKLSQKTIELLIRVKEHILEDPKRLDMLDSGSLNDAGTKACIAGWVVLLGKPEAWNALKKLWERQKAGEEVGNHIGFVDICDVCLYSTQVATNLLGISNKVATNLFAFRRNYELDSNGWPRSFAVRYKDAQTPEDRAKATADRIDYFIESGGK